MKTTHLISRKQRRHGIALISGLLFALFGFLIVASAAETPAAEETAPATNAPPAKLVLKEAVFTDNYRTGVDPFFPKSKRREPYVAPPPPPEKPVAPVVPVTPPPPPPPPDPFDGFTLKGVIGGRRPLATVDTGAKTYMLSPGESRNVKVPDLAQGKAANATKNIPLKCVRINATEVILQLEGKPEERILGIKAK